MFGHFGRNLSPEVQTFFFPDHVASWTGGTQKLSVSDQRSEQGLLFSGKNTTWKKVLRLGSAFLAGALVFWENMT